MSTKNERAVAARAKAQAQVRAKERRTTVLIVAASAVVLALFAGVIFFIVNAGKVPPLSDAHAPSVATENGGIPVGTGGVAGKDVPANAVRVDIYQDFMCPICNQFEQVNGADLDALREAGTIALYYHPISILDRASAGTKYSTRTANAAATVADQAPESFLAFQSALYANQPQENTTGLDNATIAQIAVGAGVPQTVADDFASGDFTKWAIAATDRASQDGMTGTPTVMVGGHTLQQADVSYFNPGALKAYLQAVADGTAQAPTG